MGWIPLVIFGGVGLVVLFVILTDGRYFGKQLTFWIYDRFGASIFASRSEAQRWRTLVEALELRGDEKILDVGTAIGDLPLTIAALPDFCGQAVGVDWSPQMIAAAQKEALRRGLNNRASFQVADIREGLPFDAGEFDLVFCLGLLEALPQPERMLEELRRTLTPTGVMALSLYRGFSLTGATLSLDWYQKQLGAMGVGEIEVVPCRGNQDVIIAELR